MGFGKKYALEILGVYRDHLAELLIGGPVVSSEYTKPYSDTS